MRVILLERARRDLKWWRRYYGVVFPAGKDSAYAHFAKAVMLLSSNPFLGRPVEGLKLREHPISRTPFSIVYRTLDDRLEILRVWDNRQSPEPKYDM